MAQSLDLGAIAITDHDTIEGSKEALRIGIPEPLKFLTGVEISASPPQSFAGSGSIHILGYSIRLDDPALNQILGVLQESRETRNPRIINRLKNLGIDLCLADVLHEAGDGQLGRPHIARVMLKKNYVTSIGEAFDKYLAKGKPAYVDKYRIECARAIEIILGAGGIPVLAHPVLLGYSTDKVLEDFVRSLKAMGLKGIEVYYPDHSPAQTAYYTELANHFDLLMTGGTDFHGALKPDLTMGTGRGNLFIPYELYERLIEST
jgi:predicted metal-dependent phosphoesterase TrpH